MQYFPTQVNVKRTSQKTQINARAEALHKFHCLEAQCIHQVESAIVLCALIISCHIKISPVTAELPHLKIITSQLHMHSVQHINIFLVPYSSFQLVSGGQGISSLSGHICQQVLPLNYLLLPSESQACQSHLSTQLHNLPVHIMHCEHTTQS